MWKFKRKTMWIFGIMLPLTVFLITLCIGRYPISLRDVFSLLFPPNTVSVDVYNIFWGIRLPRAILALFCGGALSISGAVFQGIFRNPLASPDLIGVSSGASLGAAVAIIIFHTTPLMTQLFAFAFGIGAVLLVFRFSSFARMKGITGIILSGIILNALFQSGIIFLKYTADPLRQLPALEYWLMGSLNTATWGKIAAFLPICLFAMSVIVILRWQVNLLSLGEEEASALGVRVKTVRILLIGAATILVALIVSMVGIIGWIGLVAPHATRLLFGDNNQRIIPLSFSLGAVLLLIADTASRSISTMELPVSIITALLGAPFLAYILFKKGVQTWK
ncbi:MAG: FecCD family ABC transporter permease [Candidatus Humimicrobiaceae bacterium]